MEDKRSFGYICPKCGKQVIGTRSRFALLAAAANIECACGESSMQVETDGERFRLWVPCGFCGEKHQAECRIDAVMEGNGIGLACPATHQLCCYAGDTAQVHRAVQELEQVVEKEKAQTDEPAAFADNTIMYEVLSELKDIAARDGISCSCGSHRYQMQVRHDAVDLTCSDCGGRLRIGAATDEDLDRLCCQIKLQIKGR
jgi:predicted RNA-binding Zn-ribbon protein involved in translation (DUF1610 family)